VKNAAPRLGHGGVLLLTPRDEAVENHWETWGEYSIHRVLGGGCIGSSLMRYLVDNYG
jgi:hypothetical protein